MFARLLPLHAVGQWALAVALSVTWLARGQEKAKAQEPAPLPGCEEQIKAGKEKGKQEGFYPLPSAKVREAAKEALQALEFKVKKDAKDRIEAHKARHVGVFVGSGGEKVVLYFKEAEEGGQKGTLVTGETKKGFVGRAGQKSWTNAVLAQTRCVLQREQAK